MGPRAIAILAASLLVAAPGTGHAALSAYSQDFEGLLITNPAALSGDGWIVYGNVFTPGGTYIYGYGPFPAPNGGSAFSDIDTGQGGPGQGAQQLSIYSDYNNLDHANGNWVESNVYREQTIVAGDVDGYWTFQFDAKLGNLIAPSTAWAFIKTLNPAAGYATTNFRPLDTTGLPTTWSTYEISILITPDLVGQILQIGFANKATGYVSSGVFYDNIFWYRPSMGVGGPRAGGFDLRPAAPSPFRGSTRFEFTLPRRGFAEVGVFDVAGRLVATLFRGEAEAGPHGVSWNGRLADGQPAPAGVYRGVLRTAQGHVARSVVLTR
jgi:hypothetical protein